MGFALGWNYLMKYLIVTPNNINAAGKAVIFYQPRLTALLAVASVFMLYELKCI